MAELKEYKLGMDYTAKTFAGLEEILAEELKGIGAEDVTIINRGVKFRGDTEILFKANYLCRTALRILKPVGVFKVKDQDELYSKVRNIDWTKIFNLDQTFIVNGNVFHSELNHSHYVALKTKDAIVDQFRDKMGKRPWVGLEDAQIFVDVHISHDECTVSLDSSGESLHRRGYRITTDKAPLSEVLAAGMIKLTGWKGDKDFYDPMCGSGTIPLEAAMSAMNIPAGYYRKQFAFMNWAGYDEELWKKVKEEADLNMTELECNIFASDRSEKAVKIAKYNVKNAGLHKDIDLSVKYFDSVQPSEEKGILVFNPPYGKRLEERGEIFDLYRKIGDVLKQNFQGYEAWVISSNMDAAKFIGLRPSSRLPLFNGPIETKFIKFEMYEGSKKGKYEDQPEGDKGFRKSDDGEKRDFRRRDDSDKKDFRRRDDGERKDFRKRDDDGKRDFRRRDGDDKKDFRRRDDGERKDFRKRDDDGKRDFRRRDDDDKKDFRRRDDGERKDFRKRDDDGKRDFRRRDGDDKKDFRRRDDGERKDFQRHDDSQNKDFKKPEDDEIKILRPLKEEGAEDQPEKRVGERKYHRRREDPRNVPKKPREREARKRIKPDSDSDTKPPSSDTKPPSKDEE